MLLEIQQVRPGLFIGTQHAAEDEELLQALGITHIACLNGNAPQFPNQFEYHFLTKANAGERDPNKPLKDMLEVSEFIQAALTCGGNVFIHCSHGANRSGAMLIGYLMMSEGLPYMEALASARQARPCVSPRAGWMQQLLAWEYFLSVANSTDDANGTNDEPLENENDEDGRIQLPPIV
jgi:protein-tyrosine phosphatase